MGKKQERRRCFLRKLFLLKHRTYFCRMTDSLSFSDHRKASVCNRVLYNQIKDVSVGSRLLLQFVLLQLHLKCMREHKIDLFLLIVWSFCYAINSFRKDFQVLWDGGTQLTSKMFSDLVNSGSPLALILMGCQPHCRTGSLGVSFSNLCLALSLYYRIPITGHK